VGRHRGWSDPRDVETPSCPSARLPRWHPCHLDANSIFVGWEWGSLDLAGNILIRGFNFLAWPNKLESAQKCSCGLLAQIQYPTPPLRNAIALRSAHREQTMGKQWRKAGLTGLTGPRSFLVKPCWATEVADRKNPIRPQISRSRRGTDSPFASFLDAKVPESRPCNSSADGGLPHRLPVQRTI